MGGATHCECRGAPYAGCGQRFTSTKAFDTHRAGAYNARRCLNVVEMIQAGMRFSEAGLWSMPEQPIPAPISGVGAARVPVEGLAVA
jgi:2-keto-3-deoxy-galactonokinase